VEVLQVLQGLLAYLARLGLQVIQVRLGLQDFKVYLETQETQALKALLV
tara:strand:+ start:113 stop:259 length:147 start_codon:yes stop_codon:yes gene_type:complete